MEGQDYVLFPHVGHPQLHNGDYPDYTTCSWLLSYEAYQLAMRIPAPWLKCGIGVLLCTTERKVF